MSVAFAEPVLDRPSLDQTSTDRPSTVGRAGRPTTAPTRTRPRRTGPGVGPTARPRRLRFSAPAVAGAGSGPRACAAAPAAPATRSWHLTERGLAVVLVVAAALVAASIAVVGLTALRVTSESYHPGHRAVAPVFVEP